MAVMTIDPNVQVALITIISTAITTSGVVVVAMINNRKERSKAASAGVEAGLDERDVLERMLSLIAENDRKEGIINDLKDENSKLRKELKGVKFDLVAALRKLKEYEPDARPSTD